ncbi:MAG: hypothetical protein ACK5RI_07685 [Bacteroidota bacterium]
MIRNSGSKGNEQVQRRDEQIRRILSAAQYKKYKEAEGAVKSAIKGNDLEKIPSPALKS